MYGTILQNIYNTMMNCERLSRVAAFELFHCQGFSPRLAELRQLGVRFQSYTTDRGITQYFMNTAERDYNRNKFFIGDIVAKKRPCTKKAKR